MELNHRTAQNVDILQLNGRFDAYEVPNINNWLNEHTTIENLIINLDGVDFIDSSALSALVKGLKRCRQNGGNLYLSNMQQAVLIIFELTRLDKAFNIFESEDEALKAIG